MNTISTPINMVNLFEDAFVINGKVRHFDHVEYETIERPNRMPDIRTVFVMVDGYRFNRHACRDVECQPACIQEIQVVVK